MNKRPKPNGPTQENRAGNEYQNERDAIAGVFAAGYHPDNLEKVIVVATTRLGMKESFGAFVVPDVGAKNLATDLMLSGKYIEVVVFKEGEEEDE
jgi:hypothetical protein